MANRLGDFASSDVIFVDANIFLHNAFATPDKGETVKRFLEKIELTQAQALTSVLVINEVLFKLSLQIAASLLPRPTPWNLRKAMQCVGRCIRDGWLPFINSTTCNETGT